METYTINFHDLILTVKYIDKKWVSRESELEREIEKLKKQNEILREALDKFVNKSNVVTAYSRHGQPIHKDYIIDLYEAQLNAEQSLKDVEGVG